MALATAPAAQAQTDFTLRAKGSSTGLGKVTAIGAFKPQSDPSLGAAVRAFGPPSSVRPRGQVSCRLGWRAIGLRITFVNLGGGSACDPALGKAQIGLGLRAQLAHRQGPEDPQHHAQAPPPLSARACAGGARTASWAASSSSATAAATRCLRPRPSRGRVGSFKLNIGAAGE